MPQIMDQRVVTVTVMERPKIPHTRKVELSSHLCAVSLDVDDLTILMQDIADALRTIEESDHAWHHEEDAHYFGIR